MKIMQVFVILGVVLTLANSFSINGQTKTHVVEMIGMTFVPDKITVKKGDSIKFINKSNILHNVVIQDLEINSKFLNTNQSVTIEIDKKGKFDYYCLPHRSMNMKGIIISE